jgi:hypothetical protein
VSVGRIFERIVVQLGVHRVPGVAKELVGPEIPAWEENTEREQCFSNESTGEDGAA